MMHGGLLITRHMLRYRRPEPARFSCKAARGRQRRLAASKHRHERQNFRDRAAVTRAGRGTERYLDMRCASSRIFPQDKTRQRSPSGLVDPELWVLASPGTLSHITSRGGCAAHTPFTTGQLADPDGSVVTSSCAMATRNIDHGGGEKGGGWNAGSAGTALGRHGLSRGSDNDALPHGTGLKHI